MNKISKIVAQVADACLLLILDWAFWGVSLVLLWAQGMLQITLVKKNHFMQPTETFSTWILVQMQKNKTKNSWEPLA